jgi:hypothetical protein
MCVELQNHGNIECVFNRMMAIRESGLLQIWKRRWWPRKDFCGGSLVTETKIVDITDVQGAFYLAAIGVALGIAAFGIELLVNCIWGYRRRPKLVQTLIGAIGTSYGGRRARRAQRAIGAAQPPLARATRETECDALVYLNQTGRPSRRSREARVCGPRIAQGASLVAWSKNTIAESQTDSSR